MILSIVIIIKTCNTYKNVSFVTIAAVKDEIK